MSYKNRLNPSQFVRQSPKWDTADSPPLFRQKTSPKYVQMKTVPPEQSSHLSSSSGHWSSPGARKPNFQNKQQRGIWVSTTQRLGPDLNQTQWMSHASETPQQFSVVKTQARQWFWTHDTLVKDVWPSVNRAETHVSETCVRIWVVVNNSVLHCPVIELYSPLVSPLLTSWISYSLWPLPLIF